VLLDSNILIYCAEGETPQLDALIDRPELAIASVTRIETLGFHRLHADQREFLERAIQGMREFPLDERVIVKAVELRQQKRMGLADAIIAATALVHALPLVTRNTMDFQNIEGLRLINPVDSP
jgi:predicted nucleic acid-binding protein